MDENCNMVCGIDKLAELLIERGIEFSVIDEVSLVFKDGLGNLHECWMAGADENRVNALIVVTPEQLPSVPDLNGIIAENERLKALVLDMYRTIRGPYADRRPLEAYRYMGRMRALGIEVR